MFRNNSSVQTPALDPLTLHGLSQFAYCRMNSLAARGAPVTFVCVYKHVIITEVWSSIIIMMYQNEY